MSTEGWEPLFANRRDVRRSRLLLFHLSLNLPPQEWIRLGLFQHAIELISLETVFLDNRFSLDRESLDDSSHVRTQQRQQRRVAKANRKHVDLQVILESLGLHGSQGFDFDRTATKLAELVG